MGNIYQFENTFLYVDIAHFQINNFTRRARSSECACENCLCWLL